MDFRPPCWREGQSCPNNCARALYQRTLYNETPLYGPWSGWRMIGQRLVSPHREWIAAHVLDRFLHARGRFR
jgi:hypothetical protein